VTPGVAQPYLERLENLLQALEQPSAVCDYLHKSISYLRTIT
jgi:hypothetical protein